MRQALSGGAQVLQECGIDTPALDARLLLCHAAGLSHERLIAHGGEPLDADADARFAGFLARRLEGEPVSRILGVREFYGRPFRVARSTLDPRPDTETVIAAALDLVVREGWHDRPLRLLDLGTGSGCILLTLLAELPQAEGLGTDISAAALAVAAENARHLGLGSRARFAASDWLEGVEGRFDLIVSNPPYIPTGELSTLAKEVADHDPRPALDGGADGLDAYRRIAAEAPRALVPGGHILVEIGPSQGEEVSGLFRAAGLETGPNGPFSDLAGRPRCVLASEAGRGPDWPMSGKISLETRDVQGRFVPAE